MFPENLRVCLSESTDDAFEEASSNNFDFFIVDHKRLDWTRDPFINVKGKLKIICWCHNFVTTAIAKKMVKSKCLHRVISVGREQMDLIRDDRLFLISDYIYNSIPIDETNINKAKTMPYTHRPHAVAYLGSLVEDKNFHILASIWHNILKKVPDAQLYVIGSGKVYSRITKLGKYGIASEKYEKMFMQFLIDEKGEILPSVHFLGAMGEEKFDVLQNIRVGCPNPTGSSETFCLSAVEMQLMGCSVAAMEAPGYYDTFYNGKISKNINGLVDDIVSLLLEDAPKSYEKTIDFIVQTFSMNAIMPYWEKLLGNDPIKTDRGGYLHQIYPLTNPKFRCKWLKEISRRIRKVIPVLYYIPNIDRFISLFQRVFH